LICARNAGCRASSQRAYAAPAQHQVEQTSPDLLVRVTGQVDHARHLPAGAEPARPPHVLVDAERLDLEGVPERVPVHVEPAGQRVDGGVVIGQGVRGPDHRPAGQQRPRRRQLVRLGERHHGAPWLLAAPDPLAPVDPHPAVPERCVVQQMLTPVMRNGQDTAPPAALERLVGLHRQIEP